ncbi:MAG: gliding motility-associated ABC transporter permease subunit GldF [Prevotellaceae bacterium]|jgi:ABC-2 type transport system permease protein|nr:gliding motility-associated ABC transporter permease subunit GldF [Prevotellaceae bacterium]
MLSIYRKELSAFFSNATGYIVGGIFLLLTGLFLWVVPGSYNVLSSGYANVDGLFVLAPWLFLFLCPAVTMRLFAEEKQLGTWELLVTKPVSPLQIALEKYFAALTLVVIALIPTVLYYFSVVWLAEPFGNVDAGAFWGAFIGLLFLSAIYVAIGVFGSALANNQIVAFIVTVVICFFMFYGFALISSFFSNAQLIQNIENLGINAHYNSISRGVIDSRDVAYFILIAMCFIFFTIFKIKPKQLR